VDAERDDPRSMLTLHRRLIELRRKEPAIAVGDYQPIVAPAPVIGYVRRWEGRAFAVALNLSAAPVVVALPGVRGRIAISTALDREGEAVAESVALRADEGVVIDVDGDPNGDAGAVGS
jgi:alpha-glucosidase